MDVATITFEDLDTMSEAVAIVRREADSVVLGLSVREDGDIQVVMTRADAPRLLEALKAALA